MSHYRGLKWRICLPSLFDYPASCFRNRDRYLDHQFCEHQWKFFKTKAAGGLTSMSSVVLTRKNLDTIGASERTVADVFHGLKAIASADERDPLCLSPLRPRKKDYNQFLASECALLGASFGLLCKR
jgi:hypothetical protein